MKLILLAAFLAILAPMIWVVTLIPMTILSFIGAVVVVVCPLLLVGWGVLAMLSAGMAS